MPEVIHVLKIKMKERRQAKRNKIHTRIIPLPRRNIINMWFRFPIILFISRDSFD